VLWFKCVVMILAISGVASSQAKKPAAKEDAPKWKAIWEPAPYNKDIELTDIACTGPETCWVAGGKGTIIETTDGGKSWKTHLGGDPEGREEDFAEIFFLDGTHGWAMTERHQVVGMTNGAWSELSKVPSTARALTFVAPQRGILADRSDSQSTTHLNRTEDGGKTWKRSDPCSVDTTVDNLPRKLGCMVQTIQFVSPTVGFMGSGAPINMGTDMAAFSKSSDAGATWVHSVIPATKHRVDEMHFWSEKDGIVVLSGGEVLWTADAGGSWSGSVSAPAWKSHFASGQGKIIVGVSQNGSQAGYSFNGGRSFSSRAMRLPAQVRAVEFPDATHGYLVGQHGMAYRYRIVPAEYTSQGMIAAPAAAQ